MPGCWVGWVCRAEPLQPIHPPIKICFNLGFPLSCWAQPVWHRLEGARHQTGTPRTAPSLRWWPQQGSCVHCSMGSVYENAPGCLWLCHKQRLATTRRRSRRAGSCQPCLKRPRLSANVQHSSCKAGSQARHSTAPHTALCALTSSCTGPHSPLEPPAPTGNLWAAAEGCVGSWTLWQPSVCHHSRALECCSSHTDRACQAADTAGGSLLPEEQQGQPCCWAVQ